MMNVWRHVPRIGICVCVCISANVSLGQGVTRRGGEGALRGSIALIDDSGVTLQSDLGATHFVPWDRVASVESRDHQSQIDRYRETATALWRARSRVERNDLAMAEPLLERLFEQYRGQTHETALVVAEGLLRCRLGRGAQHLAIIPALETIRLRRAGVTSVSYSMLPDVIDKDTSLCLRLPPYWLDGAHSDSLQLRLNDYDAHGDAVVAAIAALYRMSLSGDIEPVDAPDHAGVTLLRRCLAAFGDENTDVRESARNWLLEREQKVGNEQAAWCRFFAGVSFLKETGVVRQQRGILNLLHLPARFAKVQPYLSGIAMTLAADVLESEGDRKTADAFRSEFRARFPYHPAGRPAARQRSRDLPATEVPD
ncbi:MAG: hypothetical protein ACR2GY_05820 [Phycisphaerales bacterium]